MATSTAGPRRTTLLPSFSLGGLSFLTLCIFISTIPWERSVAVGGIGAAGKLVGIAALLLGALTLYQDGRLRVRRPNVLLVVMLLFLGWSALSTMWSIVPNSTVSRSITYFQLILMVWLIWQQTRSHRRHLMLMQAYVVGGYVSITSVVLDFVRNGGGEEFRVTGIERNANWAALAIAVGVPMAWYLLTRHRSALLTWLNVAYVPLAVFAIGLTASRGGLFVCVIGLSVILLTYGQLGLWRKIGIFVVLVGALYAGYTYLPQTNFERLAGATGELAEGTLSNRRIIWGAAFEIYWDHPYFGAGSGAFRDAVEVTLNDNSAAHNAFIAILVELGIVGVLLFGAIFVTAVVPIVLYEPFPTKWFYLVFWGAIMVALMPANWEVHKATWFVMALLSTRRSFVLGSRARSHAVGLRPDGATP